jgi:hypothetical protein
VWYYIVIPTPTPAMACVCVCDVKVLRYKKVTRVPTGYTYTPTCKKVRADSVPFGTDVCTRGEHVWAAYIGETLVCIAATKKEVLRKYQRVRQGLLRPTHDMNASHRNRPHPLAPGEPIGVESGAEYAKRIRGDRGSKS